MNLPIINYCALSSVIWPSLYITVLYPAACRRVVQFYTLKEEKLHAEEYFR
jgi:hypothetical protein